MTHPCPSCGLVDADEGDGYCVACGHRLAAIAPVAPVAVGATVGGLTVTAARAADEVVAQGADGAERLVAFGSLEDLRHEETALHRLAKDLSPKAGFALPHAYAVSDTPETGPFLVLSTPPRDARPIAAIGSELSLDGGLALARRALDVAEALEARGMAWEPRKSDFLARDGGELVLARLRGVAPLVAGERLQAKRVLEAVGATLLPFPLVHASSSLVRSCSPSARVGEPRLTLAEARDRLDEPGPTLAGPLPSLAELCDPGMTREHNEDATAIAAGGSMASAWAVLVVCDGVSSSTHAERASAIAAQTTRDALAHFARSGDIAHEGSASAVKTAIRAAHVAVCASHIEHGETAPPGTTLVAALVHKRRLTVGWIGDSRAYWISHNGSELLTHDHSWVNETVARGEMTEAAALNAPLAHALTRCIGPLEVGDGKIEEVDPDIRVRPLLEPGHVVLCTDGLWNYFPSAPDIALLVRSAGEGASAPAIARVLVNHALARGGGDNVSVAVCAFT